MESHSWPGVGVMRLILALLLALISQPISAGQTRIAFGSCASLGQIVPGEGVELVGGDRIQASVVVSNADPRTTLRLLGEAVDEAWREQVEGTHPGGSVIGVNGRNAAMAILNG